MKRILLFAAPLAAALSLPAASFAQLSFQPSQPARISSNSAIVAHGDFNHDGREDMIVNSDDPASQSYGNELYLSTGDGTYATPVALPAEVQAVGDFNQDGNLDVAAYTGASGQVAIYLGNGDGTFQSPHTFMGGATPLALLAVDLNHDNKTDLVQVLNANGGTPLTTLQTWISNGDGTFTQGQTLTSSTGSLANDSASSAVTGDFDGDGKPDIALIYGTTYDSATAKDALIPTVIQVWYGDGAGHLGSPHLTSDPNGYADAAPAVADLTGTGISDIVTASTATSGTGVKKLTIFYGSQARTLSGQTLATSECVGNLSTGIAIADFNGDRLPDLAYTEQPCNSGAVNTNLVIRIGEGFSGFDGEQILDQNLYQSDQPFVVRTTLGTKPDLIYEKYDGGSTSTLDLLTNTSHGTFPGCGLKGMAEGIQVCAPSGSSAASPVTFSLAAAGPTPMRTMAVWVDGQKEAEQLTQAFSNYSFFNGSIALPGGTHTVTVYGTGWDNTLQRKSFNLKVSDGVCAAPSQPGVNVCQPAGGAAVASPVSVSAAADVTGAFQRMELWVDGVKRYTETTGPAFTTALSLPAGSHRFGVFAVNTAGTKWEQVVYATVK